MLPSKFAKSVMSRISRKGFIALVVLINNVAQIVFMFGYFFPPDSITIEDTINRFSDETNHRTTSEIELLVNEIKTMCPDRQSENRSAQFDKSIFILVDGLAADFLDSLLPNPQQQYLDFDKQQKMPFVESLLALNQAQGFIARAAVPTVTSPRLKALVSGTLPSFIDMIANLMPSIFERKKLNQVHSSELDNNYHHQDRKQPDTMMDAAHAQGKRIVFYGDDTWLSLFDSKSLFLRSERVISFIATEYTTVDTNVTRRALSELEQTNDWDMMILHYLGLDHIGHTFDRRSPLVANKLIEIDSVVRKLYESLRQQSNRSLIVVCGDHGMNQQGNHGGGSDSEIQTAMIFIPIDDSSADKEIIKRVESVEQIDFAVTFSLLMGLEIPHRSRGRLIRRALEGLSKTELKTPFVACAYFENSVQLHSIWAHSHQFDEQLLKLLRQHNVIRHQMSSNSSHNDIKNKMNELVDDYDQHLLNAQTWLLANTVNNHLNPSLFIGAFMSCCASIVFGYCLLAFANRDDLSVMNCYSKKAFVMIALFSIPIFARVSTDFVEFESDVWPYFVSGALIPVCLTSGYRFDKPATNLQLVIFLIGVWISYAWNTYYYEYIFNTIKSAHISLVLSFVAIFFYLVNDTDIGCKRKELVVKSLMLMLIFVQKITHFASETNRLVSLCSFVIITIDLMISVHCNGLRLRVIRNSWLALTCLLQRPQNVILFAGQLILSTIIEHINIRHLHMEPFIKLMFFDYMARKSFFDQGNTNSLSTIDIAPGYTGQSGYSLPLAALLVMCSTYSFFLFWFLEYFTQYAQYLSCQYKIDRYSQLHINGLKTISLIPLFNHCVTTSLYLIVCIVLYQHPIIFLMLCPKIIYDYVTSIVSAVLIPSLASIVKRETGLYGSNLLPNVWAKES